MNANILLVEDEPLIQLELEAALTEAGFEVIPASSAGQALSLLDGDATLKGIVTDIDLGDGPTGWDVARRARELMPAVPIVYVSAMSSADWTAQGVPSSVMIAKPFAAAQLVVALSTLINKTDVI